MTFQTNASPKHSPSKVCTDPPFLPAHILGFVYGCVKVWGTSLLAGVAARECPQPWHCQDGSRMHSSGSSWHLLQVGKNTSTIVADAPFLCELSHCAGKQNSILITHPHWYGAGCSCSGAGSKGHVPSCMRWPGPCHAGGTGWDSSTVLLLLHRYLTETG